MPEFEPQPTEEPNPYREVLLGMTAIVGDSWNGYGVRLWIRARLKDIEGEDPSEWTNMHRRIAE